MLWRYATGRNACGPGAARSPGFSAKTDVPGRLDRRRRIGAIRRGGGFGGSSPSRTLTLRPTGPGHGHSCPTQMIGYTVRRESPVPNVVIVDSSLWFDESAVNALRGALLDEGVTVLRCLNELRPSVEEATECFDPACASDGKILAMPLGGWFVIYTSMREPLRSRPART